MEMRCDEKIHKRIRVSVFDMRLRETFLTIHINVLWIKLKKIKYKNRLKI